MAGRRFKRASPALLPMGLTFSQAKARRDRPKHPETSTSQLARDRAEEKRARRAERNLANQSRLQKG